MANWIKGAINPAHKGYCTPMSKSTCTPRRKALAKRFKKGGDLHAAGHPKSHHGHGHGFRSA
jgi:hypothetical protein